MSNFLILNGAHKAGKTTIGELLEEKGFNFQREIAKDVINETNYGWAEEGGHDFQREVHSREVRRDQDLLETGRDHVIETWHTGNIAHSEQTADSALVEDQKQYLNDLLSLDNFEAYAIFLDMPLEKIWERSPDYSEEDDEVIDFYEDVAPRMIEIYEEHSIDYRIVDNSANSPQRAFDEVLDYAKEVVDR